MPPYFLFHLALGTPVVIQSDGIFYPGSFEGIEGSEVLLRSGPFLFRIRLNSIHTVTTQ